MSFARTLLSRLLALFHGRRADRDLAAELEAHLDALATENIRRGMSPTEARHAARREFGGVEQAKELYRERRGLPFLETLAQDVRYGIRTFGRNPGFTAIAVLTLAIGIAANAAIFSVVNAVLLRPLAYRDANQLVTILHHRNSPVAVANYIDWRDQCRSFEAMGAAEYWGANLSGVDAPEHVIGIKMTQNLLPLLGVRPMLGRWFAVGEDSVGADHEVILSYGLWQRRFAGDQSVIGRTIALDGQSYTVIGVMPQHFKFAPFWATRAEMWVPLAFGDRIHNRSGNSLRVFARLAPVATLEQARAEVAGVTARLDQRYPATNRDVVVTPLKEMVVGKVETPLLTLLGAVGFVLLIACANVAHMLLARAAARKKEIALRSALGAARSRVIRQFLTESLLLAGAGGALGLLLAAWGTRALVALAPPNIPRLDTVAVDFPVILFLLLVTALSTALFGLAPALQSSAVNLTDALKESSRGAGEGFRRSRLRGILVASEFALALILLVGAGLTIRSFYALQSVDPGFQSQGVLSMTVSVAGSREFEPHRRAVFYRELVAQTRALPGVRSASAINHLPLAGDIWGWSFAIQGRPKPAPGDSPMGTYRLVMPGYFATMRLPILRGRDVTLADDANALGVVLINERAAQEYWPGEDPIGKRISFGDDQASQPTWLTIVGIVKNAAQENWAAKPFPEVYLAALQNAQFLGESGSHASYITLVLRTAGDPAAIAHDVKKMIWSMDSNLAISQVLTMDSVVADANAQPRFEMCLLAVFGAVALILAAVGIYGVMSYAVSRRTHEIGVRISLGAGRSQVLRLILHQGMILALTGTAVGIVGALLLSRLIGSLLFGVQPYDPITFGAVALALCLVALAASAIPARRAMRVDPIVALRYE